MDSTHIILKAWKVTVVGIECDDAVISRKCTTEIVLSKKKFLIKILQARLQTGLWYIYSSIFINLMLSLTNT